MSHHKDKKIVRLAVIRENEHTTCPFGLPIPFGCKYAGNIIERMAPLDILKEANEKDTQKIANANIKLLSWSLMDETYEPEQCKYASKIFDEKDVVECNYSDTAPGIGQGNHALNPYPYYSDIFSGEGMSGLYSWPVGHYADYNISRNLFYGQFSLQSSEEVDLVKKGKTGSQ